MSTIPQTSVTLLKRLAASSVGNDWYLFYNAYKGPIIGFVHDRFPSLEPDDILQETMQALFKCLPTYQYTPDEKGHFRNYLIGIVRHKAQDALRKRARDDKGKNGYRNDPTAFYHGGEEYQKWELSAKETAVAQLMADTNIALTTRTIFDHVALRHEPPEQVAAQFSTTRNNVDQIKNRLMKRLRELVQALLAEGSSQPATAPAQD